MTNIKHVIWDWNGTILNDLWLSLRSINKVLSKRKMPILNSEEYRSVFGFPVIDYYKRIGFDFKEESFEIVGTEYIKEYDSHHFEPELNEGILECLSMFQQKGIVQNILSARKLQQLKEEIEHYQLTNYFNEISGLEDHYAASKLENGRSLMRRNSFSSEETILIGDTVHDYEVARELGIKCILFSQGHQSKEVLTHTNAHIIDHFNEAIEYITTLYGTRRKSAY